MPLFLVSIANFVIASILTRKWAKDMYASQDRTGLSLGDIKGN